ncbi:hypothetical protein IWW39_002327 [Coemansia spiralis]|uniref:Myb-like domain-containing protein n=1 Tax=Coemansia spiralis TaxID=417178 RepID=A0A9W8GH45_9FUNG|nr:hypothetical protein IWW39_002327 [Coemansia spiralis]
MILLRRLARARGSLACRCCCRYRSSQPRPLAQSVIWTQGEQERLVRLINTEYRGKVTGDWDTVVQQLRETPANYRRPWTPTERAQLSEHIKIKYLANGRNVDWDRVGRAFGRTVNSLKNTRYVRTKEQKEQQREQVEKVKEEISDADVQALDAAISVCRSDQHAANGLDSVDWDSVAKHLQRSVLDSLALAAAASSRIPALDSLLAAARPNFPSGWPEARIQRLRAFILTYYPNNAPIDWHLAALYMHADPIDCVEAAQQTLPADPSDVSLDTSRRQSRWRADELSRLTAIVSEALAQQQPICWNQVSKALGGKRSSSACTSAWNRVYIAQKEQEQSADWTPAELALVETTLASVARYERPLSRLLKALPGKTVEQIKMQLHRTRSRLSYSKSLQGAHIEQRKLIAAVGKATSGGLIDWRKVSAEIGLPPNICESRHESITARSTATAAGKSYVYWSAAEVERLKDAVTTMQIKCTLSLLVAAATGGLWSTARAAGMEVDLEWDIGPGAKEITTAMSMLRFANDTAPPSTEWVPLGWNYGSLSLQHRADSSSFVVLQVSPPTNLHQVVLGKLSDLSEVSYHPTGDGPSQVVLESKVDLDSSSPYYFKVEAHHDMLQNRTIYEGLYSIGNHWMYMGSLVLQHPNKQGAGKSVKSGRANNSESSESESNSESKEAETKSEETKSEETKSVEAKSDVVKSEEAKSDVVKSNNSSSKEAKNDDFKSSNDDAEKDQDDDAMSDKDEDDDDKDEKIKNAGDKVRRRHDAKPSGSSRSAAEDDSESDSDDDTDSESKSPSSATTPPPSLAPSKLAKRLLENDSASQSDMNSLSAKMRSAFSDFLKSGMKAIKPSYKKQSVSHSKRVAVSAGSKNKGLVGDDELSLFKNGIDFPSFSVFPRLYSGIKRLEGGDSALVRAGVYKKFQLRDRLGETFFITQGRAFAYDGTDSDVTLVRHYFLSSSYLVSLDGPHSMAFDDEKLKEQSSASPASSSSSPSSPLSSSSSSAGAESASSTTVTAAAETTSLS